jgi:hypothetical protein
MYVKIFKTDIFVFIGNAVMSLRPHWLIILIWNFEHIRFHLSIIFWNFSWIYNAKWKHEIYKDWQLYVSEKHRVPDEQENLQTTLSIRET